MGFAKGLVAVSLAVAALYGGWSAWSHLRRKERALHLERRPWLVFERATDEAGLVRVVPDEPETVLLWIRNNGNSPAVDTESEACSFFGPTRPAPGTTCRPTTRPRRVTVGPRQEFSVAIEDVTIPDRATFASGADTLWVLARVGYGDAFGHRHRNEFCYRWVVDRRAWVACEGPARYD